MEKTGRTVAIVVYPNVSMLELTGMYSILNGLKMAKYTVWIVAEQMDPVASDTPLQIVPHKQFTDVPDPTVLVVMGGGLPSLPVMGNASVHQYVRAAAQQAEFVIGVGTGSVVLAAYGLLENRPAVTHWAFAGLLNALGARYERKHWLEDGKFITTIGGTGGMDMGLQFLARQAGEKNARLLQLFAEYDPDPPFGNLNWNAINEATDRNFSKGDLEIIKQAVSGDIRLITAVDTWFARQHLMETAPEMNFTRQFL
jgi:transcriptional regulator GlxA family with amidase domain